MSTPEEFGEEITPAERAHLDKTIEHLESQMDGTDAARLATRFVPAIPDGGKPGRVLAPRVQSAAKVRDTLRIWAPATATTSAYLVTVTVFDVPGPLTVYGLGIVGFSWWHSAGRPGPLDSARMLWYATADHGTRIREWITRLAQRRGTYEARRTSTDPGSQ